MITAVEPMIRGLVSVAGDVGAALRDRVGGFFCF
jgi:hypothetical protein